MLDNQILIGQGSKKVYLTPSMANRHGLIAGATGTGKTVTLQIMAEAFSKIGVPVFVADIKGDISGLSQPGKPHPKVKERTDLMELTDFKFQGSTVEFWDLYRQKGLPMRATVSDLGPMMWSRLLELSDAQSTTLSLLFKMADDAEMLLLDLKDLKASLKFMSENTEELSGEYGQVNKQTIQTIMRKILPLEEQGAENFFGEPALNIKDLMQRDFEGKGMINILSAEVLVQHPILYSTFLLWLLSELFEELPERGDAEKPLMVFFFDEAHLLFDDAPSALVKKIEQVVRLIRSKGIGVYFVTQNPIDIPEEVLGQLGNRVQHALRAFTPKDQKAVKSAAQTFRANPELDVEQVITELGVGEALLSFLDEDGVPGIVERALIVPPECRIGPASDEERNAILSQSTLKSKYEKDLDRESAYEILMEKADKLKKEQEILEKQQEKEAQAALQQKTKKKTSNRQTVLESFSKSVVRSMGGKIGRNLAGKGGAKLVRGILGSLLR